MVHPGAAVFLAAAALVAGLESSRNDSQVRSAGAAAEVSRSPPGSPLFRFSREPLISGNAGPLRFACVGTFLAPGLAVTAAHCLSGDESTLTVACNRPGRRARIGIATVSRQVRHPTHDVTLIEFSQKGGCGAATVTIAPSIAATERFFVMRLPRPGSADPATKQGPQEALIETLRGVHTIDVLDETLCLSPGESGTPLFVKRHRQRHVIVGLLISGDEGCPGQQTFVRLDRLHSWIGALWKRYIG